MNKEVASESRLDRGGCGSGTGVRLIRVEPISSCVAKERGQALSIGGTRIGKNDSAEKIEGTNRSGGFE